MEVISKEEAIQKSLKRYFTGQPCKNGHIAERFISQNRCVICHYASSNKWRRSDRKERPEFYLEQGRNRDPEKAKEKNRRWHEANRDKVLKRLSKFEKDNRERRNLYKKEKYPVERAIWAAERRALKSNATPPWSDLKAIEQFYIDCARISAETGIKHHVDHIVPLKHSLVCGLHVPANLQIIPASDNIAKSNKFEIE
jgi:hypothetical protein